MGAFNAVNLDDLPPPQIVETIGYEEILDTMKAELIARDDSLEALLDIESEPLVKLLEVCAYRELMLRQRINDASRSVMLAYATGTDLDQIAALFGVERLITTEYENGEPLDVTQIEDDRRLRHRAQLSLEGHSTAGSKGSYVYWALSASSEVKDVEVISPSPGAVVITVLTTTGKGVPNEDLRAEVLEAVNATDKRPLTDAVSVEPATIIEYQVEATLDMYAGPDQNTVQQVALDAVNHYVTEQHRLGESIYRSGLIAALHQPGVKRVSLTQPSNDISVQAVEAAYCDAVNLSRGPSS